MSRKISFLCVIFVIMAAPNMFGQWVASGSNETTTGAVAIGTSSTPTQALDVVGGNIFLNGTTSWYGIKRSVDGAARAVLFNGAVLSDADYLYFGALPNGFRFIDANNSVLMTLKNAGNLGIGQASPTQKLDVNGNAVIGGGTSVGNTLSVSTANPSGIAALDVHSGTWITDATAVMYAGNSVGVILGAASNHDVNIRSNNTNRVTIAAGGNVGIGVSSPAYALDVNGTIHATNVIGASYQDLAEWVPASTEMAAGTVVVLNQEKINEVVPSSTAYDATVAGVVSAKPGIVLGEGAPDKAKVATTGRVKVKVDATKEPIKIGDLLVTSDKPGMAMKSIPVSVGGISMHRPGTIIGKALEPLASGTGEVLVLLSMQ